MLCPKCGTINTGLYKCIKCGSESSEEEQTIAHLYDYLTFDIKVKFKDQFIKLYNILNWQYSTSFKSRIPDNINLCFKRSIKQKNKSLLIRYQKRIDDAVKNINNWEYKKNILALITSLTIGIMGLFILGIGIILCFNEVNVVNVFCEIISFGTGIILMILAYPIYIKIYKINIIKYEILITKKREEIENIIAEIKKIN